MSHLSVTHIPDGIRVGVWPHRCYIVVDHKKEGCIIFDGFDFLEKVVAMKVIENGKKTLWKWYN